MLKKIRKLIPIVILSILLIACLYFLRREADEVFVLQVNCNGQYQTIDCWHEDGDLYYFFIPSHSKDNEIRFELLNNGSMYLDDTKLEEGMSVDNFEFNKEHILKHRNTIIGKIVFMCGYNVPTIFISTESGSMKKLDNDIDYKESAKMSVLDIDGNVEYYDDIESISGRGNGSWKFDKKGYTLTLKEKDSILGFRESDKFVLVSNHYDDTCGFRNMFAYNMAKSIGMEYTCDIKFVNVYFNNVYHGLYTLIEKIDYNEKILDIGDLETENIKANNGKLLDNANRISITRNGDLYYRYFEFDSPKNISGGYIIERNYGEKFYDKDSVFVTNNGEGFVIRVPSIANEEEVEYIQRKMQSIENALFSDDYIDLNTEKSFEELVDVDSFIQKYLVDEVTKNEGAGSTSNYFYKKINDEKIYSGPVWDYDKSLGNFENWISPKGLTLSKLHKLSPTLWYERMYQNEDCFNLIKNYYKTLVKPYCQDTISHGFDGWKQTIENSFNMNYIRWKNSKNGNISEDLNVSTNYIENWLIERLDYLDSVWCEND